MCMSKECTKGLYQKEYEFGYMKLLRNDEIKLG